MQTASMQTCVRDTRKLSHDKVLTRHWLMTYSQAIKSSFSSYFPRKRGGNFGSTPFLQSRDREGEFHSRFRTYFRMSVGHFRSLMSFESPFCTTITNRWCFCSSAKVQKYHPALSHICILCKNTNTHVQCAKALTTNSFHMHVVLHIWNSLIICGLFYTWFSFWDYDPFIEPHCFVEEVPRWNGPSGAIKGVTTSIPLSAFTV